VHDKSRKDRVEKHVFNIFKQARAGPAVRSHCPVDVHGGSRAVSRCLDQRPARLVGPGVECGHRRDGGVDLPGGDEDAGGGVEDARFGAAALLCA
jgi:hypothetical protein